MNKIFKIILLVISVPALAQAQFTTKYALILGLNDYYREPGVKHGSSLHGCVNDANAIRVLLINRFGFHSSNIQMLYNEKVTRKNVLDQMHVILEKCRPGDAFVFFYSGHGAWMSNSMNKTDSVKRGMSQAMVMSDLYSPNLDCLLTDEMLKTAFNEFVDKKVIVTSLFDCCYSGNLAMPSNSYWRPFLKPETTKGLPMGGVPFIPEKKQPRGCTGITDTVDSDRDGVPDCKDWEIDSPPFVPVDDLGVTKTGISAEDFISLNAKFDIDHAGTDERSYNMKDALKVWYPLKAKRPSDRPNSNFISISAASDVQPGIEIRDENETRHGAFTKAILSIYKEHDAKLPLAEVLKKISQVMKTQGYSQIPTAHYDPGRLKGNLVGTSGMDFNNKMTATCIDKKNDRVTIDKGMNADIARGNIFKDLSGKISITITNVYADSAEGIDQSHLITRGQKLELIDRYSISNPIVKIFIPVIDCSVVGYEKFIGSVKEYFDSLHYCDYNFQGMYNTDRVTIFSDGKNYKQWAIPANGVKQGFNDIVLLPVPSYVVKDLGRLLSKDQNVKLMNDPKDADYVLYLNFIKQRAGKASAFVFYFHPPIDFAPDENHSIFSEEHLVVPSLNLNMKTLPALSEKLYAMTKATYRYKSTHWINHYPRR